MIDNAQERQLLIDKLSQKKWFANLNRDHKELINSSASNSVLDHLSRIDEELENRETVKVLDVVETKNLWVVSMSLRFLNNNQESIEEFVFPKDVDNEMGKSMILIKRHDGKTFVVLNKDTKSINIKYPSFSAAKTVFLPAKLEKWLKERMKFEVIAIKSFVDLGIYRPYSELSTIQKPLFAILVETEVFDPLLNSDFMSIDTSKLEDIINNSGETAVTIIAARLKIKNLL
jgi:hypothetical protein